MNIFRKYYRIQASRGISPSRATLLLPWKSINHVLTLGRYPRGVTYGYGFFDRPLLASYSRSGTNWIRYIIESISGRPTPGQKRLIEGKDYFIDRAHCAYPRMQKYESVLLVIRDYRECLLRHHKEHWAEYKDVVSFLTDDSLKQPPSWYIRNIVAFDSFAGKKLFVYYEDLIDKPKPTIRKVADFLELEKEKTEGFIDMLDIHSQKSVDAYRKGGHSSDTSGTRDLKFHANSKLNSDEISQFDDFYFSRYRNLTEKYLLRYRNADR